jgi:hypothetical protein
MKGSHKSGGLLQAKSPFHNGSPSNRTGERLGAAHRLSEASLPMTPGCSLPMEPGSARIASAEPLAVETSNNHSLLNDSKPALEIREPFSIVGDMENSFFSGNHRTFSGSILPFDVSFATPEIVISKF